MVSILYKLALGEYPILCSKQLPPGYLHTSISEPYDSRIVVVIFLFSLNVGAPQLLVLRLHLEAIVD